MTNYENIKNAETKLLESLSKLISLIVMLTNDSIHLSAQIPKVKFYNLGKTISTGHIFKCVSVKVNAKIVS